MGIKYLVKYMYAVFFLKGNKYLITIELTVNPNPNHNPNPKPNLNPNPNL